MTTRPEGVRCSAWRTGLRRGGPVSIAVALWLATACGAGETSRTGAAPEGPPRVDDTSRERPALDEARTPPTTAEEPTTAEASGEVRPEATEAAETMPPRAVEVRPGRSFGPIELGMERADLEALGLESDDLGPRQSRFADFLVRWNDQGRVGRVEAQIGELSEVSIDGRVFAAGVHIHEIRDGLGDCVWQEGGGERYRCRDGGLWVFTTHSLNPLRYTIRIAPE